MPVGVIDGFKVVDIDDQQCHVRSVNTLHQHVVSTAVEESGQSIV